MCGRFALSAKTGEIENLLPEKKISGIIVPRYNIAPTQQIAAVLNSMPTEISHIRWGLIPFWAKDESIGNSLINARAETLQEKSSFKMPLRKKRCLIPASGFYEWKALAGEKRKIPHFIRMKNSECFTFAGLWDSWKDSGNNTIITATIITTVPNELMAAIHNRMPVIIPREKRNLWLSNLEDISEIGKLLLPYPSEEMIAYPVSFRVNIPAFDDEECTKAAE